MSGSVAAVNIVVACLCAALAACSGGANSDEIVELTTTSPAVESTTAPSSTTSPTTTEAPTTTTTEPQTTSTTTAEDLAAEIEADLQAGRDLESQTLHDPSSFDEQALGRYFSPTAIERLRMRLDGRTQDGTASRPGPTETDIIEVESVSVLESGSALVVFCLSNDAVIYDVNSGEVVNDDAGSIRSSRTVSQIGGTWRTDETTHLESFEAFGCE